jgi:hypothetical protein
VANMPPNVTVEVNKAERDAIEQVIQRHGSILDKFERDLLKQLLNRIDGATASGTPASVDAPRPGRSPQESS